MNYPVQLSYEELIPEVENIKSSGKSIAFCHGSFDILHDGHRAMLRRAKEEADISIVGIGSDQYVRQTKGEDRPRNNSETRMQNLLDTGLVDIVFEVPYHDDPVMFYRALYGSMRPNVLLTGNDELLDKKQERAEGLGIRIIVMEKTHSSSAIIKELTK